MKQSWGWGAAAETRVHSDGGAAAAAAGAGGAHPGQAELDQAAAVHGGQPRGERRAQLRHRRQGGRLQVGASNEDPHKVS